MLLDHKLSFEHIETGMPLTIAISEFYKLLGNGEISILAEMDDQSILKGTDLKLAQSALSAIDVRAAYYVNAVLNAGIPPSSQKYVPQIIRKCASELGDSMPPSVRTVLRWCSKSSGREAMTIEHGSGYIRSRSPKRYERELACIKRWYMTEDRRSIVDTYAIYFTESKEAGLQPISASTFNRIIRSMNQYLICKSRYGDKHASAKFRTTFKTQPVATRPNQVWQVDHTPLDFIVVCQNGIPLGRPTVTSIIDSYSKFIVSCYIYFGAPSKTSIFKALKIAICPDSEQESMFHIRGFEGGFGLPQRVIGDRGSAELSHEMRLRAKELGFDWENCAAYTPYEKPDIEGFFRRLKGIPVSAGRVYKASEVTVAEPKTHAVLTLDVFRKHLYQFIHESHHKSINRLTGERPLDRMMEGLKKNPPIRLPVNSDVYDLLAAREYQRVVDHKGVQLFDLIFAGPEIDQLKKSRGHSFRTAVRIDPTNLSSVFVMDPANNRWVRAYSTNQPYTQNLSLAQHLLIKEEKRKRNAESGKVIEWLEAKALLAKEVLSDEKAGRKIRLRDAKKRAIFRGSGGDGSDQVLAAADVLDKISRKINLGVLSTDIELTSEVSSWNLGGQDV